MLFEFKNSEFKKKKPSLIKTVQDVHFPKPPQLLSILILFFNKKSHKLILYKLELNLKIFPYLHFFLFGKTIIFIYLFRKN